MHQKRVGRMLCSLLIAACAIGLSTSSASGQSRDDAVRTLVSRDGMPPHVSLRQDNCRYYITRAACEGLMGRLSLSGPQENAFVAFHDRYLNDVDAVYERVFDRLLHGSLGDLVSELILPAIEAGTGVTDEVLDAYGRERAAMLMRDMARDLRRAHDEADEVRRTFELEFEAILSEEQRAALPAAMRALRRDVLLRPLNPKGMHYDLDLLPDVIALHHAAIEAGQELEPLYQPGDEDAAGVRENVSSALDRYERGIDALLLHSSRRDWELHLERFTLMLGGDRERAARAHKRQLEAWRRVFDETDRAVGAIADAVEPVIGLIATEAWMRRYHQVTFPELFCAETPELMYEWLAARDLDRHIRKSVDVVYESYLRSRATLRNEAKTIRLKHRMTTNDRTGSSIDSLEIGIPADLQEVESRRAALAATINTQLRSLLEDPAAVEAFDECLRQNRNRPFGRVGDVVRY